MNSGEFEPFVRPTNSVARRFKVHCNQDGTTPTSWVCCLRLHVLLSQYRKVLRMDLLGCIVPRLSSNVV
jgi:hypothetical protein